MLDEAEAVAERRAAAFVHVFGPGAASDAHGFVTSPNSIDGLTVCGSGQAGLT